METKESLSTNKDSLFKQEKDEHPVKIPLEFWQERDVDVHKVKLDMGVSRRQWSNIDCYEENGQVTGRTKGQLSPEIPAPFDSNGENKFDMRDRLADSHEGRASEKFRRDRKARMTMKHGRKF